MPRTSARKTIARGIYGDSGGFSVRVTVQGQVYERRLPLDTTRPELLTARAQLIAEARTAHPPVVRGTLQAAVPGYLRLVAHLASADDIEDHLAAWCDRLGTVARHRITRQDIAAACSAWLAHGLSPKTINNRVITLRAFYHRLDGKRAATPCDDLRPLPVPKTPIQRVSEATILAVDAALQRRERHPSKTFDGAKTRARFRVLVSTGKRPCEVMRAQPADVNLDARVWVPRDAKGGFCPGVYLNKDQLAAWRLFIEANAWGPYNHGNFARVLRHAGWPASVKPYQARHSTWIAASERGADLADIAVGAGHRDVRTTRRAYVPVLNSRLQKLGEVLEGRFQGWPEADS
jgi:integrase